MQSFHSLSFSVAQPTTFLTSTTSTFGSRASYLTTPSFTIISTPPMPLYGTCTQITAETCYLETVMEIPRTGIPSRLSSIPTIPSAPTPTETCEWWNWSSIPSFSHHSNQTTPTSNHNHKRGNAPETTSQTALRTAIEAAVKVVMNQTLYECAVGKTLSGCELFGGGFICGWTWEKNVPAPKATPSEDDGAGEVGSIFWSEPVEGAVGECEEECGDGR